MGAANKRGDAHADSDHHDDEPDDDNGDDVADGIDEPDEHDVDQRCADHVTDDDHAGAPGRASSDAVAPQPVAEPVALTGTRFDHQYTGVP